MGDGPFLLARPWRCALTGQPHIPCCPCRIPPSAGRPRQALCMFRAARSGPPRYSIGPCHSPAHAGPTRGALCSCITIALTRPLVVRSDDTASRYGSARSEKSCGKGASRTCPARAHTEGQGRQRHQGQPQPYLPYPAQEAASPGAAPAFDAGTPGKPQRSWHAPGTRPARRTAGRKGTRPTPLHAHLLRSFVPSHRTLYTPPSTSAPTPCVCWWAR